MNLPSSSGSRRRAGRRFAGLLFVAAACCLRGAGAGSTDITGDDMSYSEHGQERTSICAGHVVVTSGDLTIHCDYLRAVSVAAKGTSPADMGGQRFKYLLATGNVHILQGDLDAVCERAEFLPEEGKMTLTGGASGQPHPVVTNRSSGWVFTADPLVRWRDGSMGGKHFEARGPSLKSIGLTQPAPAKPAEAPKPGS